MPAIVQRKTQLPSLSQAMAMDSRELNKTIFSLSAVSKNPSVRFSPEQIFKTAEALIFCEYSWFKKNPALDKKQAGKLKKKQAGIQPAFFSKWYRQKIRSAFRDKTEKSLLEFVAKCKQDGHPPRLEALASPAQFPMGGGKSCQAYGTPEHILTAARRALGGPIELDPASEPEGNKTVQAERYFTEGMNGLVARWESPRLWLNPPFKNSDLFIYKLLDSFEKELIQKAVTIIPASTGRWFQSLLSSKHARGFCWLQGKVSFHDLEKREKSMGGLPLPCLTFALGNISFEDFSQAFGQHGHCVPLSAVATVQSALDRELESLKVTSPSSECCMLKKY